jgi:hypothetical protein
VIELKRYRFEVLVAATVCLWIGSQSRALAEDGKSFEDEYYELVISDIAKCNQSKAASAIGCLTTRSPKRCRTHAERVLGRHESARLDWAICVRSCASASFLARAFGDCSRS